MVLYDANGTRVLAGSPETRLARCLGTREREVVGEEVRIWQHYYWPPLTHEAEIWIHPTPRAIDVQTYWEPEWTYVCDLKIRVTTTVTVVAIINGAIHEVIRVVPIHKRRRGWRRMAK